MSFKYADVLEYIDNYWEKATFDPSGALGGEGILLQRIGRIKLPYPVVSPNHSYFAGSQYYWDTYFTIIELVDSGRGKLAKGMVNNLAHLYKRFGLVPARNTLLSKGRTQPPFLTSMIWEIYDHGAANDEWLDKMMRLAADEYEKVWNSGQRLVLETGLSRYQPRYFPKRLSAYESGWDKSARFAVSSPTILPVDLNCLLYKYETDLMRWAKLRGDKIAHETWNDRSKNRQAAISQHFWNQQAGFFYDYNLQTKSQETLNTLAGYFTLWCKLASPEQAELCRQKLAVFEQNYGLATTEKISWAGRQWDYPNGWPPLHYIVIKGLRNYGFIRDADRIAKKWLDIQSIVFKRTGQLWEKYDVVRGDVGKSGRYLTQPGFAWTNSIFARIFRETNIT